MDQDDFLGGRRHALEEAFFSKVEQENLQRLRNDLDRTSTRAELGKATGIDDPAVLDRLVDLGVAPATLTAIALAPLLHVAWADGEVQPGERTAVLESAKQRGIAEGSPGFTLLAGWLSQAPDPVLHETWVSYTRALCQKMSGEQRVALKQQVISFARGVAEAAGGFVGIHKVSAAEEQALRAIGKAFEEA